MDRYALDILPLPEPKAFGISLIQSLMVTLAMIGLTRWNYNHLINPEYSMIYNIRIGIVFGAFWLGGAFLGYLFASYRLHQYRSNKATELGMGLFFCLLFLLGMGVSMYLTEFTHPLISTVHAAVAAQGGVFLNEFILKRMGSEQ